MDSESGRALEVLARSRRRVYYYILTCMKSSFDVLALTHTLPIIRPTKPGDVINRQRGPSQQQKERSLSSPLSLTQISVSQNIKNNDITNPYQSAYARGKTGYKDHKETLYSKLNFAINPSRFCQTCLCQQLSLNTVKVQVTFSSSCS